VEDDVLRLRHAPVAEHAAGESRRLEPEEERRPGDDGERRHRRADDERHALAAHARQRRTQEDGAEDDVDERADDEQRLEPDDRHEHQSRERDADDRSERVDRVHGADRPLAGPAGEQHARDQRQRHAGAEGRREHDGETDRVAQQQERRVPALVPLERLLDRRHPLEGGDVERQGRDRGEAHDPLHDAERAHRVREAVGARAHPVRSKGQSEDERREHQLERVRRAPEHQRQHPNPRDLVDERGDGGTERDGEEEAPQRGPRCGVRGPWIALGMPLPSDLGPRTADRALLLIIPPERLLAEDHHQTDDDVDRRGGDERARQPEPADQREAGEQDAARGAEAVGEVEQAECPAGAVTADAESAGAHQREGGAEQDRLRQDEESGERPLHDRHARATGERGEDRVVGDRGHAAVDVVEQHADDARRQLDVRVHPQRPPDPLGPLPDQVRPERHPAKEDDEHDDLRVRAVPDEQPEVPAPDGLVNESRGAGEDEDEGEEGHECEVQGAGCEARDAGRGNSVPKPGLGLSRAPRPEPRAPFL
jgi:hypothetical protein